VYAAREAQLARLRARMDAEARTPPPLVDACARCCAGAVVHL
jgi:hypothetical protein